MGFDNWRPTLLQTLKDEGVEENTLVILMADNGPMTHHGPDGMFDMMRARHELWARKYPHTKHPRGMPLKGLENPRPEVIKAGEFRIDPDDLPFDPKEFLEYELPYDPAMESWGSGG